MSTRTILVAFSGYPFTIRALLPHQRLAAVAGSLREAGHEPTIHDFGSVEGLARLYPRHVRSTTQRFADRLFSETPASPWNAFSTLWRLRGLGATLRDEEARVCGDIADDLGRSGDVDLAVFCVDRAEDLRGAHLIASRMLERSPSTRFVVMGSFIEHYGGFLLDLADTFEFVILADPEVAVAELAGRLDVVRTAALPPNVGTFCDGRLIISERKNSAFPPPGRACYDEAAYPHFAGDDKFKVLGLEWTRGCPRDCHTCPDARTVGGEVSRKSARALTDDMLRLAHEHGTRVFRFVGPAPADNGVSVACEILNRGMHAVYMQPAAISEPGPSAFPTLRAAGCLSVSFGIDSGSQRLLDDFYMRGFGVTEAEDILRASREAGLFTATRFTYPCPADDYHTRAETVRMIRRTTPDSAIVQLPEALPGSNWFRFAAEFGFVLDVDGYLRRALNGKGRGSLPLCSWKTLRSRWSTRSLPQACREYEELADEIEEAGISTNVDPVTALIARVSGYEGHERDFGALLRRQLITGDAASLAALARRFNERARLSATTDMLSPLPAAVGN